jgi:uncharacterized OsmC-like protein
MTSTVSTLNHITAATRAAVADDTRNAQVTFTAAARGLGGVASSVALGTHTVVVDEPPALGGANAAPNPVEFYLASLLSCHIVTYRFWAERLGVRIDELAADAEGDLDVRGFFGFDDAVRPGFTAVRVTVRLTGPETRERYLELHEAVERHCPVLDLTRNHTEVAVRVETNR